MESPAFPIAPLLPELRSRLAESTRLVALYEEMLALCRKNPEEARRLVGSYLAPATDPAEAAAWVVVARTIMNLDEFVTRE